MNDPDLFGHRPAASYPAAPGHKERGGTSQSAAEDIKEAADTVRTKTMECLTAYPKGLTADECAAVMGYDILTVRPRLSELFRRGEIIKTDKTRPNHSGKQARVYAIK